MKRVYDFSRAKRGAVVATRGKTRITIYLDDEIVQRFKAESQVRKILREELEATQD